MKRNRPTRGRKGHSAPDIETGECPINVSMDYMYSHERFGKLKEAQHNAPYLVVVEHKFCRCWAHQVPTTGMNDEAHWVPKRALQDLENNEWGERMFYSQRIRNPPLCACPKAMEVLRLQIVPINSPAGESACNGRVENTIRRVQEKIRVLRHQL